MEALPGEIILCQRTPAGGNHVSGEEKATQDCAQDHLLDKSGGTETLQTDTRRPRTPEGCLAGEIPNSINNSIDGRSSRSPETARSPRSRSVDSVSDLSAGNPRGNQDQHDVASSQSDGAAAQSTIVERVGALAGRDMSGRASPADGNLPAEANAMEKKDDRLRAEISLSATLKEQVGYKECTCG